MNKSLAKATSTVLATESTRDKAGMELVKIGGAGMALWVLAWFLPIISLPMIFVAMAVVGFML